MNTLIFILIYLVCSTAGLMLLKQSLTGISFPNVTAYFGLMTNLKFVSGFLLYAMSFCVWMLLLSRKDLSYIYPIVIGLSYLTVMLASVFILKESFSIPKAFGATLIGLGAIIIFIQK